MATRMHMLSQPKPNRLRHPDRRSVYWLDELPRERTGSTTKIELTPRWLELCRSKKLYSPVTYLYLFPCPLLFMLSFPLFRFSFLSSHLHPTLPASFPLPRLSPIWEVGEWALRAVPSKQLCNLAQPRVPAAGWQPDRTLLAPLSRATQTAVATSRICQLAQPKRRQVREDSGHKSKPVPVNHLPCKASAHLELLSSNP
ncbi:theg spermatid protein isoform X3 [Xiphias gladius]|uniref:theg spermatid protein isoform X3 n=1 Tax=Xiphias gladius TaxID=8245 RepID=UPI001A9850ED|nr:theg spermatid protein isoform X3 [Xiphias gladius]